MQQGSVILTNRKFGPDVWQFRWSEKDRSGRRIYRKRVIGTVKQYPDAQAARRATNESVYRGNSLLLKFIECTIIWVLIGIYRGFVTLAIWRKQRHKSWLSLSSGNTLAGPRHAHAEGLRRASAGTHLYAQRTVER